MSKITNDGLTRSGTACFIAVPIWHQWASKGYCDVCECFSDVTDVYDCLSMQEFDSLTVKPVLERTMLHFASHRQKPLPHVM